jgi:hypothetical protein
MTLVIDTNAAKVRLLWAEMLSADLLSAKEALREREGITGADWSSRIGAWQTDESAPATIPDLPRWAEALGLEAVIWTALGPKFSGKDVSPSADEVITYLQGLTRVWREHAKRYIECAPRQIDTEYRRRIEAALGWSPKECH